MSGTEQVEAAHASDLRHVPLPAFTSIAPGSRSSVGHASHASSSRSQSQSSLHNGDINRHRWSLHSSENRPPSTELPTNEHRRSRQRGSGGFLLDDTDPSRRLSQTLLSRSLRGRNDVKGKRRSEDSELHVTKRRQKDIRAEPGLSIGSSPLAGEIKEDGRNDRDKLSGSPVRLPQSRQSMSSYTSGALRDTPSPQMSADHVRPIPANPLTDTNSAQIVSLALSLGEARRRHASGLRSASAALGKQRVPSTPLNTGSVREYVASQQRPTSVAGHAPKTPDQKVNGFERRSPVEEQEDTSMQDAAEIDDEESLVVSAATVKRVEKAKNFFELAYEHRKLLTHLPPLRNPRSHLRGVVPEGQSRNYNPLQYVRNRKLRFRNREPIHAEGEGWHDISPVKHWVDAVIEAHTETRHDPDECIRLPDFLHHQRPPEDESDNEDVDATTADQFDGRRSGRKDIKPYRPRQDWKFHPGDLIADVYWLEQGLNKTKIEDRDGNRIYPHDLQFKRSGWRRGMPVEVPRELQEPTPPPDSPVEVIGRNSLGQEEKPELPTFRSAQHDKKLRKGRGLTKFKSPMAIIPRATDRLPKSRSKPLQLDDSASSSTASDSEGDGQRGRNRRSRRMSPRGGRRDEDLRRLQTATTISDSFGPSSVSQEDSLGQSPPSSKRGSIDAGRIHKLFTRESTKAKTLLRQSKSRSESTRRDSHKPKASMDSERGPRSSAEYDTTVPSSPSVPEVPSIAINLSPPHSRSQSPAKKSLPARLNPFRDRSKQREGVDVNDFGVPLSQRGSRQGSAETEGNNSSSHGSRGTSPMTRGKSPLPQPQHDKLTEEYVTDVAADHRDSTVSKTSNKSGTAYHDPHRGIRGMFKGGRIAEIVGTEVSRVGDFILKREPPALGKVRGSASTVSLPGRHSSDTEDEEGANGTVFKTPPKQSHSRYSSQTSNQDDHVLPTVSKSSPDSGEQPHYNNPNLPVFISPFQRDKEQQEAKERTLIAPWTSDQSDHMSQAAAEHRLRSKSPRMDLLALPRIDTSRPGTPPGLEHRDSYGFGSHLDLSKSRNASQIFNEAITGFPASGLLGLKSTRSAVGLSDAANQSQHQQNPAEKGPVTIADLGVAYVGLSSSAIKAREIARRANLVRDPLPKWVLDSLGPTSESLHPPSPLRIKRRDEHVVAARNLFATLSMQADAFNDRLQDFQSKTSPSLHGQLQKMEDLVESMLSPKVQKSADDAGNLSMQLATSSTLAVKGVNDQISLALRLRRRGPVRILRNFGYKLIELGVVGLLWAIWLVVTMVRIVIGIFSKSYGAVRWLLWLY